MKPTMLASNVVEILAIYKQLGSIHRTAEHFGKNYYKMRLLIEEAKRANGQITKSTVKSVDDKLYCLTDGTALGLYHQGYSDAQIARAIGGRVTMHRVRSWRIRNGLPVNAEHIGTRAAVSRKMFAEEHDGAENVTELNIVNLLYNHPGGLTAREISEALELNQNYVYIVLRGLIGRGLVIKLFKMLFHPNHAPKPGV